MAWDWANEYWNRLCYFYYRQVWARKRKTKKFLRNWLEEILTLAALLGVAAKAALPSVQTVFHGWLLGIIVTLVILAVPAGLWRRTILKEEREREALFLVNITELQRELEYALSASDSEDERTSRLRHFVTAVLRLFYTTLDVKKGLDVNLMIYYPEGVLRIREQYGTGPEVDPGFEARPGWSGAGVCFKERKPVYIPNVRRRHGLLLNIARLGATAPCFKVLRNVYEPVSGKEYEVFRSILSVPVMSATNKGDPYGVLNFDSPALDPFDEIDFKMAVHFGHVLGMALAAFESGTATLESNGQVGEGTIR